MLGTIILILLAGAPASDWTAYDVADGRLTAAYTSTRAHLNPAAQLRLRSEERRWIAERNIACGFEARNACSLKKTIKRTVDLESLLGRINTYKTMDSQRLLRLERVLDEACRGSSQDADGPICVRRDTVVRHLKAIGWCYGPDDAYGYQQHWMRADINCHP